MDKITFIIFFILFVINFGFTTSNFYIPTIKEIGSNDPLFQEICAEIRYNRTYNYDKNKLSILPMRFIYYTPLMYDDIYRVASYFSLSIDTIASVNQLNSQFFFKDLKKVLIPNIDGMFIQTDKFEKLESIYKVDKKNLEIINKNLISINSKFLFMPFATFPREKKILFLGSIFKDPLNGNGTVTSLFGTRTDPVYHYQAAHGGIDLGCSEGTPVYPSMSGKVIFAGFKGDYGNVIIIDHGFGYQTAYGHLSEILIKLNDTVDYFTQIGSSGSTGKSTGPHLHFEIIYEAKKINPLQLMAFNK